jgi:hypothetical protein
MKFERAFLLIFNLLLRGLGVVAIVVGISFILIAYVVPIHRTMDAVAGVCAIVIGVVFLVATPVTAEQIGRIRGSGRRE